MSATIHYRKVSQEDPYLKDVWAPSEFIASMERAFGQFPCTLGTSAIPVLRGMAAVKAPVDRSSGTERNPYLEVIQKIEQSGSIELYATY